MKTVTQHTSLTRMASETLKLNLVYVLNKVAEISIRVLSLFLWSVQVSSTASRFIFSAESGIDEQ